MSDDDLPNEDQNNAEDGEDEALSEDWAAAMAEAGETEDEDDDNDESSSDASADANPRAPLESFEVTPPGATPGSGTGEDTPNLDVILDIPVVISMEVGNTQIPIRNLLQLNQGSVIELDRLAGEPLDVLVNGTLIAHGEVVMVNEKFGIRLTDVVSQQERIQRLR